MKPLPQVRRFLWFLVAGSALVPSCTDHEGVTAPSPAMRSTGSGVKGTLSAAACVSGDGAMAVAIRWDGGVWKEALAVELVFHKKSGAITVTHTMSADEVFSWVAAAGPRASLTFTTDPGRVGDTPWNQFSSIGVSTTGAFFATTSPLRQPKGGWGTCPPS